MIISFYRKLWLLIATALLSNVSASPTWEAFAGIQEDEGNDNDSSQLEKYDFKLPSDSYAGLQTYQDVSELQQDGEDVGYDGQKEETAVAQWNNKLDDWLYVKCREGYGLNIVYSIHVNRREDRLYDWRCQPVSYPSEHA